MQKDDGALTGSVLRDTGVILNVFFQVVVDGVEEEEDLKTHPSQVRISHFV